MKKTRLHIRNIRLTILAVTLLFVSTTLVALADPFSNPGAPTTPQPFSVACDPYSAPLVAGAIYEPSGSICTYTIPQTLSLKFVGIYKGVPGNSVPVKRGFSVNSPVSTLSDTGYDFSNAQVGDSYYAAAFSADNISDAINYDNYLQTGVGSSSPDLTTLAWIWDVPPPIVIITPGQGAVYLPSDTVVPFASFTDLASYTTIVYTLNGNQIDPTQPLPLGNLPAGTSTLVIAATNTAGHTDYATTTFMVLDHTPPTVAISTPANGATFLKTDTVAIATTITDVSPIASVVFTLNGAVMTSTSSLPLSTMPLGTSTLVVAATDSSGNVGYATSTFGVQAPPPPPPPPNPSCLLVLNASAKNAVNITGSTVLRTTNCGIQVNSNASPAFNVTSSASIGASNFCVVGQVKKTGSALLPSISTPCAAKADPFAAYSNTPTVPATCTYTNYSVSGTKNVTLTPGTYCGGIKMSGTINATFSPGIYILKDGPFSTSGTTNITGTGVAFYLIGKGAGLSFTSTMNFRVSAPSSGPLAGFAVFLDPNDTAPAATSLVSGSTVWAIDGVVYLPHQQLSLTGSNSTSGTHFTSFTVDTLNISASTNLNMDASHPAVPPPTGF